MDTPHGRRGASAARASEVCVGCALSASGVGSSSSVSDHRSSVLLTASWSGAAASWSCRRTMTCC